MEITVERLLRKRSVLFLVLTGLLLGLAFTFPFLNLFVFIAFVPLFRVLDGLKNDRRKIKFGAGFLAGFIYFLFVFQWLWGTYPLESFGLTNRAAAFTIILLLQITAALVMGVFWGLFGFFYPANKNRPGYFLILPLVFVFFEFVRSYAFGLFWAGPETLLGPHWTFGNPAYLTSSNGLFLFLAQFVGIYGIGFLVVFLNILLFSLARSKKRNNFIYILVTLFGLIGATLTSQSAMTGQSSGKEPRQKTAVVSIIQTRYSPGARLFAREELSQFNEQISLLKKVTGQKPSPDIVIFPEGADFFKNVSIFLDPAETQEFFSKISDREILIIDNSRLTDEKKLVRSRTIYLDSKKGVIGHYDKRLLTPAGESLPYLINWIAGPISSDKISFFNQSRAFSKGGGLSGPVMFRDTGIGGLICSGLFSPSLNRSLVGQGSDIIIIQASTGVFRGHRVIVNQNLAIARMRAAENRRSLVLAANYGLSYFISPHGNVQKIAENTDSQILTEEVVLNSKKTLYNKVGDMPFILAGFALIALSFLNRKNE